MKFPNAALAASTSLLIASLAFSAASAGCGAAPKRAPAQTAAEPAATTRWAILMYERDDAWHRLSPAKRDGLMRKYAVWIADLEKRGIFKGGTPMGRGGVRITMEPGIGAQATALRGEGETLTGMFLIETTSTAEAERIAATCPALLHGETVHLRPVGHE